MILQLLHLLFINLGFCHDDHAPKNSLYPRREPEKFSFNLHPVTLVLVMLLGVFLFVLLIFLFTGVSAVESGTYYNGLSSVI